MIGRRFLLLVIAIFAPASGLAGTLTAEQAAQHAGEIGTVCGVVASAHYAPRVRGQPTFLNLDKPYPHPSFTALVWGEDRGKFGQPEQLEGKHVCVTGMIRVYRGAPEIILHEAKQLQPQ